MKTKTKEAYTTLYQVLHTQKYDLYREITNRPRADNSSKFPGVKGLIFFNPQTKEFFPQLILKESKRFSEDNKLDEQLSAQKMREGFTWLLELWPDDDILSTDEQYWRKLKPLLPDVATPEEYFLKYVIRTDDIADLLEAFCAKNKDPNKLIDLYRKEQYINAPVFKQGNFLWCKQLEETEKTLARLKSYILKQI